MNKWDQRFLNIAKDISTWSKDPRKKVGCVIVDDDHNQLSGGFNGFPRGVCDDARLDDQSIKLKMIVHAEANAVAASARNGHSLKFSTAYITHPPCVQCAALLIQAGVKTVIYWAGTVPSKWESEWELSKVLLTEAGVSCNEIALL